MAEFTEELRELEESLWQPLTRFDRAYMESVLAENFVEFGRSGRVCSRAEILDLPVGDFVARLPLPGFAVRMITNDVAVVTYRSEFHLVGETMAANRMSLWRRDGILGWQLEFHQGTPVDG